MYITYILESIKSGKYYIGHTQDIVRRLVRHNSGFVIATRNKGPWKLIHQEPYETKADANRREMEIKSKKSRSYIQNLIK